MTTINPKAVTTNKGVAPISKHNAYPTRKDFSITDLSPFSKEPPGVRQITDHVVNGNGGDPKASMHNDYPTRKNGPTPTDLKPFRNSPPAVQTRHLKSFAPKAVTTNKGFKSLGAAKMPKLSTTPTD